MNKKERLLKQLIKPPFLLVKNDFSNIPSFTGMLGDSTNQPLLILSDYRGSGRFSGSKEAWDAFFEFVLSALSEKWEKVFSKPLHWIAKIKDFGGWKFKYNKCPVCEFGTENEYNFCPYCGQKLKPSKGKKNG